MPRVPAPGAGRYRAGRAFEYAVRQAFERLGWRALRSAGSHGIDLVVWNTDGRRAVLACRRHGELRPAERNATLFSAWGLASEVYAVRAGRDAVFEVRAIGAWGTAPWRGLEEVFGRA